MQLPLHGGASRAAAIGTWIDCIPRDRFSSRSGAHDRGCPDRRETARPDYRPGAEPIRECRCSLADIERREAGTLANEGRAQGIADPGAIARPHANAHANCVSYARPHSLSMADAGAESNSNSDATINTDSRAGANAPADSDPHGGPDANANAGTDPYPTAATSRRAIRSCLELLLRTDRLAGAGEFGTRPDTAQRPAH